MLDVLVPWHVLLTLICAVAINTKPDRVYVCQVVLWVYVLSEAVFMTPAYRLVTEAVGFYVYSASYEVLVVLVLAMAPSILGVQVMVLCLLTVSGNMLLWWVEAQGVDSTAIFNNVMLGLFVVQAVFLFSERVSNGTHGFFKSIAGAGVVRHVLSCNNQRNTEGQS